MEVREICAEVGEKAAFVDDAVRAVVERLKVAEAELISLKAAQDERLLDMRAKGHGDGQMHAIADVNAGLVDDLIRPRLEAAEATCTALRQELAAAQASVEELTALTQDLVDEKSALRAQLAALQAQLTREKS